MNPIKKPSSFYQSLANWKFYTLISLLIVLITLLFSWSRAVALSATIGMVFLVASLAPFELFAKWIDQAKLDFLAKNKKDFGIAAGFLFVTHASIATTKYINLDISKLFTKELLPGLIFELILITMLITSIPYVQKLTKEKWKIVHQLIYLAVPLGLFHSLLAALKYTNSLSLTGFLGFGLIILFVIYRVFIDFKAGLTKAILILVGIALATTILVLGKTNNDFDTTFTPQVTSSSSQSSSESSSQESSSEESSEEFEEEFSQTTISISSKASSSISSSQASASQPIDTNEAATTIIVPVSSKAASSTSTSTSKESSQSSSAISIVSSSSSSTIEIKLPIKID